MYSAVNILNRYTSVWLTFRHTAWSRLVEMCWACPIDEIRLIIEKWNGVVKWKQNQVNIVNRVRRKKKIYEKELWKFSNTCTLDNLEFISFSSWHFNHILGSIHLAASFSTKRFFCTRNPKRYGQFNSLSTLKAMFVDSHKEHVASILTQHCPPSEMRLVFARWKRSKYWESSTCVCSSRCRLASSLGRPSYQFPDSCNNTAIFYKHVNRGYFFVCFFSTRVDY